MTTLPAAPALDAPAAVNRLAHVDLCEAIGLTVREGGARPRMGDMLWIFTDVEGLPAHLRPSGLTFDFTAIDNPRWRVVAQEFLFARMAPWHEAVRELAHAYRTHLAIDTASARLDELVLWFNWLTARGITSLREVDQSHCQAFYLHRSVIRSRKTGKELRPASDATRLAAVMAMKEPALYSELFSTDGFADGFVPWPGRSSFEVSGYKHRTENVTQPLGNDAVQRWLAAALYIIETLGPHVLELSRSERRPPDGRSERNWQARIEAVIDDHIARGVPFDDLSRSGIGQRTKRQSDKDDPLFTVNLQSLAWEANIRDFRSYWLEPLRPQLEAARAKVGTRPRYGRNAALVPRADGQGEVPWTEGFATNKDVSTMVALVRSACALVTALLTGMRASELMCMPQDACLPAKELGGGRTRYRLRTRLIKGVKTFGGVWEEWVTIAQAYQAVELAVALRGPQQGTLAFGRMQFSQQWSTLRDWVNGPAGRRLGLAPIPEGKLNLTITRRTLAMELAHRPGGLLAAKVHLKHVSVVTTEGYAARPGGAQAAFLAEVAQEEQVRNQDLTLAAFREAQQGNLPAGPGASDLIDFFASVDDRLREMEAASPGVKAGDQEVLNLLARRANTLHLGTANYCWFIDPTKALCLILAGKTGADRPLAGMCDSARCPQATHHPCHRPVWAESAENKKIFIESIGRGQKTEKARLQADLDRDLRVLAEIDAATGKAA